MKVKILAALLVTAGLMVSGASAATIYVASVCGTFSNPLPNAPLSGMFACPTAASLGLGAQTIAAEFLIYDADYSSGITPSVNENTSFTFTGFGGAVLQWTADTVATTGAANSTAQTCTSGATINPAQTLSGTFILAGCYDSATGGTLGLGGTVSYTNTFPTGNAVQGTGYAEIVYAYNVINTPAPEPVSSVLLGGGFLVLGLLRRNKFGS